MSPPRLTLAAARAFAQQHSHAALVQRCLDCAAGPAAASVFTRLWPQAALAAAQHADAMRAAGVEAAPLAGLPVSVKDLFDIAGEPTTAGSVLHAGAPPAAGDAAAVRRLRAAGAALLGRTQMSEFAFSGVGMNPHHGTPRNPADAAVARIPGGSSSGAAVSVGLGLAVAGLGSDTGGSLRVPAALCGLVGFKPTQVRVPRTGAFALSHTLDTVGAITNGVADALALDAVLADVPLRLARRDLRGARIALPQTLVLDNLDETVARCWQACLTRLSAAGARLEEIALPELAEIAPLNAPGGFSAVEAYALHRDDFAAQRERYDPRVAQRIALGEGVSAADYLRMVQRRRGWITRVEQVLEGFDAFASPTVPIVAPTIDALAASDEAFFRANGLLLRNTFVVNFLDGCAISLPCHAAGDLPVGLMLAAPGGADARLLSLALACEAALARG